MPAQIPTQAGEAVPSESIRREAFACIRRLVEVKKELKALEQEEADLKARLTAFQKGGVLPDKFDAFGLAFTLTKGRETKQYPSQVKAQIKLIQTQAEAKGLVTVSVGEPSWRIAAADSAADSE